MEIWMMTMTSLDRVSSALVPTKDACRASVNSAFLDLTSALNIIGLWAEKNSARKFTLGAKKHTAIVMGITLVDGTDIDIP